MLKTRFDSEKAIEAILFVTSIAPIPDLYHVGKILYFADRLHLEDFGRLITSDSYIAMKNGPVASGTYDILKIARGDPGQRCPSGCSIDHVQASLGVLPKHDSNRVIAKRTPNMDFFSKSDISCIQKAVEQYGNMTFDELNDISHDEVWKSADRNNEIPLEVIASHCKDGEQLIAYLRG